jgi:hypothetical protein
MTRKWWRTLLGVTLGVLAAALIRSWVPSVTFPRAPVSASLMSMGFAIPDVVYDDIDFVLAAIGPVFLPVLLGTIICVLVAGTDGPKRGINLGLLVANIVVTLPLVVMILLAFARGLSFPLATWLIRVLIQPVAAVVSGIVTGALMAVVMRIASVARSRASSSL